MVESLKLVLPPECSFVLFCVGACAYCGFTSQDDGGAAKPPDEEHDGAEDLDILMSPAVPPLHKLMLDLNLFLLSGVSRSPQLIGDMTTQKDKQSFLQFVPCARDPKNSCQILPSLTCALFRQHVV